MRSTLGIRAQVILLAIVPLAFLMLNLGLVMLLARSSEQSVFVSQRVTRVLQQSDRLSQLIGRMSRSVTTFSKTRRDSDLVDFDAARSLVPGEAQALEDLVRGDASLEPAGARYVKAVTAGAEIFEAGRKALQAGRQDELRRIMAAKSTKALGVEFEQSKVALSAATATAELIVNSAGRRSIANLERMLLVSASLGVITTILLAVFLGLRTVQRLGMLADNARRLGAGEAPVALTGSDEITQLDGVYREMFAETVQRRAELAAAKLRLERAVRAYGDLAARIASGDLTARATVDDDTDELGQLGSSLNRMAASLERLVEEIGAAATSLASATNEILAATSQQVSSATEEAAAVRETAGTVLEVRQTAEMAARKTRLVAELAQRVEQTAVGGRQSVEESVQSSEGARERMLTLSERILAFSEQAQTIAEINATVAELAGQSNLLAVNAAIEAAKAGEASKGFAIVAAEVKELGARSKEATVQVRRIVTDIQKSAQSAVMAAEQGVRAAESGTTIAQRSGAAMEILTASITEASEAAQQINASAEQQQAGMDQIAQAMQHIEQASTQTVAATQQVERAAADLSQLAQKLTETIHGVRVS